MSELGHVRPMHESLRHVRFVSKSDQIGALH
jgi:hypothetical protein